MNKIAPLLACVLMTVSPALAAAPTTAPTAPSALETQLGRKLPEINLNDVGLGDSIDFLRDITGVPIVTDARAFKAAGVTAKTPITLKLRDVTLQHTLEALCEQIGKPNHKFAARAIRSKVVISSPARLDAAEKQYAADAAKAGKDDPLHLNRRLPEINFSGIGLTDAIDFLRDVTGTNINVNWTALQQAGIKKSTPVTTRLRDIPFHEGLRAVLDAAAANAKADLDFKVNANMIDIFVAPPAK